MRIPPLRYAVFIHREHISTIRSTAQLHANSKIFDVPATHLSGNAVVLSFGGSYRTANGWRVDLGIGEDIEAKASPDATINIAVRHAF